MYTRFLVLILTVAIFSSCEFSPDDLNDLEIGDYDAEFAVPLFRASTSLDEVLENVQDQTTMTIDPDGGIRLKYQGDVLGRTSQDLFDIVAALVPIQVSDSVVHETFEIPGSIDIDFINLSRGDATMTVSYTHLTLPTTPYV